MADKKVIALFGAGTGLGTSLATRFGQEGYRVALIARNADRLREHVADLARDNIEATAFAADLTDIKRIAVLISSIEEKLGSIDVIVYAPVPSDLGFVPAVDLTASYLQSMAALFTFAPVEVSHASLPGMLARGDGAIVVVGGLSAVYPKPGLSGVGPLMAATRNYILTLNAEVAAKGVYAGTVSIGAMIDRSAVLRTMNASDKSSASLLPLIDPDEIAQEVWTRVTQRDQVEAVLPL